MLNIVSTRESILVIYIIPDTCHHVLGERRPSEAHIILKELLRFFTEAKVGS